MRLASALLGGERHVAAYLAELDLSNWHCPNPQSEWIVQLEARVLNALQTRFFESAPFQVFCEEFTAAVNEARMEARRAPTSSGSCAAAIRAPVLCRSGHR